MALNLLPNNAMTFTENQHGTAVLEKLRNQRELVRCCDVILHVAGSQFQAHRCVLAACSPYFDSIFKTSKTVKEQLTISSQDPDVFRCLLAYMYTGTVVVDKTNVAELLRLANKLLIAKLKEHCAEYLERYLDSSNCLTVRDMATKFNLEALEKTTGNFVASHLTEIIEGEEVLELSHSRLEDFLSSPFWHLQEYQTLLLVTRWVYHCPKARERILRSLLTWVQWCHLDPQIAIRMLQTHPLYSGSSSFLSLFFLLDALNDHSILPKKLYNAFFKLKDKYCQLSDSLVDSESFLSLAISTAIDELQEDQIVTSHSQDTVVTGSDFCSHENPLFHNSQGFPLESEKLNVNVPVVRPQQNISEFPVSLRRSCDEQDGNQETQYSLCRVNHNEDDMHVTPSALIFPHHNSALNVIDGHPLINEDSVNDATVAEDGKFTFSTQEHFGPSSIRNMTVWHQDAPYGNEESLSSDSGQMYQRQDYNQDFNSKMLCVDSYNEQVKQIINYPVRESPLKNKHNISSAVSYYVSNYNPDDDMTVSDDQSTQSFQYDENLNAGMNFYTCRIPDIKDTAHNFVEAHRMEENYPKAYYPVESNNSENTHNIKTEAYYNNNSENTHSIKTEAYYNDNSTDTQLSNCPQDMTIQNHLSSHARDKEHELSFSRDLSVLEEGSDIMQGDAALPLRLVSDQQAHFEQHPLVCTSADEELREEVTRSHIESAAIASMQNILKVEDITSDIKKNMDDGSIEMSNFLFLKEEIGDRNRGQNDIHLEKSILTDDNGESVQDTITCSAQHSANEVSCFERSPLAADLHLLTPFDASATSKHAKLKINCHNSMPPPAEGKCFSFKQQRIASQNLHINRGLSSEVLPLHREVEGLNPDDPEVVIQDNLDVMVKIPENAQGNQEVLNATLENEEKGNAKNVREMPSFAKKLRRMSRRNKPDENCKDTKKSSSAQRICDLCQKAFSRKKDYFIHMREHFPGPPHRCDTCDTTFKRIYYLLDHLLIHQDSKTHKCPHCPFSTHKRFNLNEHILHHSKIRKYKCKQCGEQFNRLQILQTHETKHTKDRPFLCETCGWSGKSKNALALHLKIHRGDLMRCQFPKCKYRTAKTSHLKEHIQRHSKSRPCICNVCGYNFITNSHLNRHMKLHLSEKPFKCLECDYATMRRDYLKTHIWKKHTKKKTLKVTTRRRENKKKKSAISMTSQPSKEVDVISAHIECSQADIFSDLENTNVSLQPQLPDSPLPKTLTEYPPSPSYSFQAQAEPSDTLMLVPEMSSVTESFTQLPHTSPLHRNLTSNLTYDESYQSPQYQTSPSHFTPLSPSNASLSYANDHRQEESPLNFTAYIKYD